MTTDSLPRICEPSGAAMPFNDRAQDLRRFQLAVAFCHALLLQALELRKLDLRGPPADRDSAIQAVFPVSQFFAGIFHTERRAHEHQPQCDEQCRDHELLKLECPWRTPRQQRLTHNRS